MTIQTVTGVVVAIVVNQVSRRLGKRQRTVCAILIYGAILSRHVFVADEGRTTLFIVCMAVAFFLRKHDRNCRNCNDH